MRARHITTGVTLLVLVVALGAMTYWGVHAATSPLPSLTPQGSGSTCSQEVNKRFLDRKDVTVSVLNAGIRVGAAASTMASLETLGFMPGRVANAPRSIHVHRTQIWTRIKHDPRAKLVKKVFGRRTRIVVNTKRYGPGVVVFIGDRTDHLRKHASRQIKLAHPLRICVQGG